MRGTSAGGSVWEDQPIRDTIRSSSSQMVLLRLEIRHLWGSCELVYDMSFVSFIHNGKFGEICTYQ